MAAGMSMDSIECEFSPYEGTTDFLSPFFSFSRSIVFAPFLSLLLGAQH